MRAAWLDLQAVADRYQAIRRARSLASVAGLRGVQHDQRGEFADLRDPHALTGHRAGSTAAPPMVDCPAEPAQLLLWLVGSGKAGAVAAHRRRARSSLADRLRGVAAPPPPGGRVVRPGVRRAGGVTTEPQDGGGWLREQVNWRKDPAERAGRRDAVTERLFGPPAEEPADDQPGTGAA